MILSETALVTTINRQSLALSRIMEILAHPDNTTALSSRLSRELTAVCAAGLRWPMPTAGCDVKPAATDE